MVKWTTVADSDVPTSGYLLYMDGGNDGDFQLIYDGSGKPGVL